MIANLQNRRSPTTLPPDELVARIQSLHAEVAHLQNRFRELRSERNELGKVLAQRPKRAILNQVSPNDGAGAGARAAAAAAAAKARAEEIRHELSHGEDGVEKLLARSEDRLLELGLELPNATSPEAPIGDYEAIQVVRTSSPSSASGSSGSGSTASESSCEELERSEPRADHVELLSALGWLHLPVHITGSSWPYLLSGGALLENALMQYALAHAVKAGYELVIPPDVVKHEIMKRCGFNPRDSGGEAQTYFVSTSAPRPGAGLARAEDQASEQELALAATAEVPLAGYFMGTLYKDPVLELPRKLVAIGHAFRAEAGARGKESRGLYRVHQFTKLELFTVTTAENGESSRALDDMTDLQWRILSGLGLPLRLLNMPSGELGGSAFRKYDIEAYMPGRGSWGELASASNCTEYQARRLDIRYRVQQTSNEVDKAQKKPSTAFCHTLNATAAAIPRLIVALVENGIRLDESGQWAALELPKSLRPYWMGKEAQEERCRVRLSGAKTGGRKELVKTPDSIELRWI